MKKKKIIELSEENWPPFMQVRWAMEQQDNPTRTPYQNNRALLILAFAYELYKHCDTKKEVASLVRETVQSLKDPGGKYVFGLLELSQSQKEACILIDKFKNTLGESHYIEHMSPKKVTSAKKFATTVQNTLDYFGKELMHD